MSVGAYKQDLLNMVEAADNVEDIGLKMLSYINLNDLKQNLKNIITELKDDTFDMGFKCLSIIKLLPEDIIQFILTFLGLDTKDIAVTCKKWSTYLSHLEREFYKTYLKRTGYNANKNRIFIINPRQINVNDVQRDIGFKFYSLYKKQEDDVEISEARWPIWENKEIQSTFDQDLFNYVLNDANTLDGDMFFVFPRLKYKMKSVCDVAKNVWFIGFEIYGKFPFYYDVQINIQPIYRLYIEGFTLNHKHTPGIVVNKKASLVINNCNMGPDINDWSKTESIFAYTAAKQIIIKRCCFFHCWHMIKIKELDNDTTHTLNLFCFQNEYSYFRSMPIVEMAKINRSDDRKYVMYHDQKELYEIKENKSSLGSVKNENEIVLLKDEE